MRVPESSPASAMSVPRDIPATTALRIGKLNGSAGVPRGNCDMRAPQFAIIWSNKPRFEGG